MVFRYIDVQQLHIDSKIAGISCKGGLIKYKLKAGLNNIMDDWLFTHCVSHIRNHFPNERRFCRILALATMFAYCDPTLRASLPELQRERMEAGMQGILHVDNLVDRVPLHIYSVNGQVCIDEIINGTFNGAGAAVAAGVPATVNTGANNAVLQSVLLQQQRCAQSISLLHMHVDTQFQTMKTFLQRQNTTLNGNIRRFGGAIQGGLARQDPVQAGNRRRAGAQLEDLPPTQPEDGTAELCPNIRNLAELWDAAPSAAHYRQYAEIIRQKAIARNLIHACTDRLHLTRQFRTGQV